MCESRNFQLKNKEVLSVRGNHQIQNINDNHSSDRHDTGRAEKSR